MAPTTHVSAIKPFLEQQRSLIIDGGLGTELEKMGFSLNNPLWSAHILSTHPDAIRDVHLSYLHAGADCLVTASYQASVKGFVEGGYSLAAAIDLIRTSVELATEARSRYLENASPLLRPLVAASIGPYGAYLSDGSEYHGDYGISKEELRAFHEPRWEILASAKADLFACETIPGIVEAEVLLDLLHQSPEVSAWVSFSCKDGKHISDGTPIGECAAMLDDCDQIVAVGVNCVEPRYVNSLVEQLHDSLKSSEIVVYPNSGEVYDAVSKTWSRTEDPVSCAEAASEWYQRGARLIGGCCRTEPEHIEAMRARIITSE